MTVRLDELPFSDFDPNACPDCDAELIDGICNDCGWNESADERECPKCLSTMIDGECQVCGFRNEEWEGSLFDER